MTSNSNSNNSNVSTSERTAAANTSSSNNNNTITPSIVLYTPRNNNKHNRSSSESYFALLQFLNQSGHHFSVREGGEPELVRRFGSTVLQQQGGGCLGVLLADCLWLPYSGDVHREYFEAQFQTFLVDLMLHNNNNNNNNNSAHHHHRKDNENDKPAPGCSNAAAAATSKNPTTTQLPSVSSPTKNALPPGRRCCTTNYSEIVVTPPLRNPAPPAAAAAPTTKTIQIPPSLRKICAAVPLCFHNNDPSSSARKQSAVRSLNGWMEWNSHHPSSCVNTATTNTIPPQQQQEETPTKIMLRLSRAMDELCSRSRAAGGIAPTDFWALERAVCELQVTPLPSDPVERVAFAINLHNLMVRHALILASSVDDDPKTKKTKTKKITTKSKNDSNNITAGSFYYYNNSEDHQQGSSSSWKWPNSINEMDLFFGRIGYDVGGERISIQDLRLSLFGARQLPLLDSSQPVEGQRHRWWRLALCRHASGADAGTEVFYSQPCIHTDVRVLLALAHGGGGAGSNIDQVETVHPASLEQALHAAAQRYCQTHVAVRDNGRVILPPLLSWYRRDLGGHTPAKVLRAIQEYLSTAQRRAIGRSWMAGDLKVCFSSSSGQQNNNTNVSTSNRLVLAAAEPKSNSGGATTDHCAGPPRRQESLSRTTRHPPFPPKLSPRKSIPQQQLSSSSPMKQTEIKLTGRSSTVPPYRNKKPPVVKVAGLPTIPSLQTTSLRPQASVGDWRVFSPDRGNNAAGGGPSPSNGDSNNKALATTRRSSTPGLLLVKQQEEENNGNNSHTADTTHSSAATEEEEDDYFPMEPGCNRRTMLLSDVSGITYGSDFDIRVSGRRWTPAPLAYNNN